MTISTCTTGYYGLFSSRVEGHTVIGHGGAINGFRSEVMYFPNDDVTIIVLSNYEETSADFIADVIAGKVFDAE